MACNFCKSEQILKKTPYVELKPSGKYEPVESFCCKAQEQNAAYIRKRFRPNEAPKLEEVAKL